MQQAADSSATTTFRFGSFSLHVAQKLLLEDGRPVRLGSRALDILVVLVERAGELVGKNELADLVWPRSVVEESSLRVHVAALRKALGDGQAGARYIVNMPGRGYSFVAPVQRLQTRAGEAPAPPADARRGRVPAQLTRMIGRAASVAQLASQLAADRFVTLVGPGGIGKTTMALAVADAEAGRFDDGVCYVDLSIIADRQVIPSVLIAGLRLSPRTEMLETLETFLRERRMLLVFDNCEHLIEDLAPFVERLLTAAPGLHVLATSREPMRAEGERLHRVGALSTPPAGAVLTAAEVLRYPAVELFVERATASVDDFVLLDADAATAAELCRRLDGNPLAIELAAARVDLFGLRGLAAQLDVHVLQLKGDRRDAPPRHHSLSAMLDWSYRLLGDAERLVLTRLSVFQGWFPLDAATAFLLSVEREAMLTETQVFDAMADLTAKSLLASDTSGEVVQFRLLELTRAFALAQLVQTGQRARMASLHAEQVLGLLNQAAKDWTSLPKAQWLLSHRWLIDEMRAALGWCFGSEGNVLAGCRMTSMLWNMVQLVNPFDRPDAVERALDALAKLPERHLDLEVRLNVALASKFEFHGASSGDANAAGARAVALAREQDDPALETEALMIVSLLQISMGCYVDGLQDHHLLQDAAHRSGSPVLKAVAERIGAQAYHFAGDFSMGRQWAQRVLASPVRRGPIGTMGGGVDHRISMRIVLSRTLWLEGFPDQAASLAEETFDMAQADNALARMQVMSLCLCPIRLWRGDGAEAAERIAAFHALVLSQVPGGVWLPSAAMIPWWMSESISGVTTGLQRDNLMTAYGHLLTPQALARAAAGAAGWCGAELLRAGGEQLLREGAADAVEAARALFTRALDLARSQQAPGWELRAATSLARLLRERLGREAEARALLEPVYRRFTEGFETADLRRAAALL